MADRRALCWLLALAASVTTAAGAESRCDVAMLRGLSPPPDQVLACVRAVAARPAEADGVGGSLLRAALGALRDAALTRPAPDEPALARALLAELQRRGALGPQDHASLRAILLLNGRFDEVAADRAAHPLRGEAPLPARRPLAAAAGDGQARFWRWDAHANAIAEDAVDLAHGVHVVVDSEPDCHFCARAIADIEHDAALSQAFRGALWITRPGQGLDRATWQAWNAAHPAQPMVVVLDAQGWALPAEWSTPRFRVFRDGQVVASVLGWTPQSRVALLEMVRAQGLLAP